MVEMAAQTAFSEHDLTEILAQYDVGLYQNAHLFSEGKVQTNLLIQTTTGVFVLKSYGRSAESVRFEINLLNYLRKRAFPCPAPIKNRQGHYFGLFQQKPYVLFEYIEGQHIQDLNSHQRTQVIQAAAQLQVSTRHYRPHLMASRWNYDRDLCCELVHAKAESLGSANATEKAKWFDQALSALRLPQALPKGICHADYAPSNLLFNSNTLIALLDFDDANYTYLVYDLAHLVDSWAWPHEGDFDLVAAREIVQDYARVRPLNRAEKHHLFDVHKLQILFDGVWFFGRGQADDFYERQKIAYLDNLGREDYYHALFEGS